MKQIFMQTWSENVMADHELSKGALRVAWGLTFTFHSDECRAWETQAKIAERLRVSESAVKAALSELERRGHIIRAWEQREGRPIRAIRPCWNQSVRKQPRRERRGGVEKGVNPREIAADRNALGTEGQTPQGTEGQTPQGTEGQTPYIQSRSLRDPQTSVPADSMRDHRAMLDDEEDDSIDMTQFERIDQELSKE